MELGNPPSSGLFSEKPGMNLLFRKLLSLTPVRRAVSACLFKPGKPLYLSVCVHTEKIQDAETFGRMLELGRALPFKPSACVMTPANPRVKADMEHGGVSGKEFLDHLKEMAGLFEIGYHGHYCRPSGTPPSPLAKTEIERSGFALTLDEPEALKSQFLAEYNYLSSNLYPPKAYSAGWWFMNSTVAGLLADKGFETDCSLRRFYRDTFGGKYPGQGNLPGNGVPFRLAGAGKVIELPSVFYLHLNWWTVVRELFPLLWRAGGPLFAVLPTHDYNLKEDLGKVLENIRLLSDIPNVRFVSLSKMKELAESSGPVFGSEGFSAAACPACGPAASRTVWREKIYRAAECENCGLIRVDPQPPGLGDIYGETYYRNNYLPKSGERLSFFGERLAEIEKLLPPGKALDVGCGVGFFLKAAAERGWKASGVETSEFAAGYARKEFGLEVAPGLPAEEDSFDLLTLWDVIAHLDDPAGYLSRLRRLAKKDALLVVATPVRPRAVFKFAAFLSRFITSRYYLHIPQQLFHFTRPSLENLLETQGFTPVRSEYIDFAVKSGPLSIFSGGPREIASKLLHYIADRGHFHDYLVVYAKKEPEA